MFEDFDRTLELIDESANSLGATYAQQAVYTDSLAFAFNRLRVAWEGFTTSIVSSSAIKGALDLVSNIIEVIDIINGSLGGIPVTILGIGAIGSFVMNKINKSMKSDNGLLKSIFGWSEKVNTSKIKRLAIEKALTSESQKQVLAETAETTAEVAGVGVALTESIQSAMTDIAGFSGKILGLGKAIFAFLGVPGTLAIAAVGALVWVASEAERTKRKLEKINEESKKIQATLFKTNQTESSFTKTLEEVEKLNSKLYLTNEEMEQLASKKEQLQNMGLDEDGFQEYNFFDREGNLNTKEVDSFKEHLEDLKNISFEEMKEKRNESLKISFEELGKAAQVSVVQVDAFYLAVKDGLDGLNKESDYNDFLKLDPQTITDYENLAITIREISDNTKEFITESEYYALPEKQRGAYLYDHEEEVLNPEGQAVQTSIYKITSEEKEKQEKMVEESYDHYKKIREKNVQEIIEYGKTLTTEQVQALISFLEKANPKIASTLDLGEALGKGFSLGDNWDLDKLNSFKNILDETLLSEKSIARIFEGDMSNAISTFVEEADKASYSTKYIVEIMNKLHEVSGDLDFNGVLSLAKHLSSAKDNINDFLSSVKEGNIDFDKMSEMIAQYPELAAEAAKIINTGQGTEGFANALIEAEKANFENKKQIQIAELELRKAEIQAEIDYNDSMIKLSEEDINTQKSAAIEYQKIANANILTAQQEYEGKKQAAETGEYKKVDTDEYLDAGADLDQFKKRNEILHKAYNDTQGAIDLLNSITYDYLKNMDAVGGATEDFILKLTELDNITQKLANMDFLKTFIDQNRQLKEAQALGSDTEELDIAKAKNEYTLQSIELLGEEIKLLSERATVTKEQQNSVLEQINKFGNILDTSTGRGIINFEELNKLSNKNKEIVQNLIGDYQEMGESIEETITQIKDQEIAIVEMIGQLKKRNKEIKETLEELRGKGILEAEKAVEDLVLAAIKEREEAKIEALQDGIDEERKLLEERKALYDEMFDAMDYEENLNDIDSQRNALMSQLASLSGATDSGSVSKRKELQDQLDALNKDYNTEVRDYNRENMWNEDEDELTAKEEEAQSLQDKLVNMSDFYGEMEALIQQGDDAIKQFLIDNMSEYADATETHKELLLLTWEEEMNRRYEVQDEIRELEEEYLHNLATISQAEEQLGYLRAALDQMETERQALAAVKYAAFASSITAQVNGLVGKFNSLRDSANAAYDAMTRAAQLQATTYYNAAGGGGYGPFATGGTTSSTGWHWLDGAPGAEERILSPTQTKIVDQMLMKIDAQAFGNSGESISIGDINLNVGSMNSDYDARTAAKTFAEELQSALKNRGKNINQKR